MGGCRQRGLGKTKLEYGASDWSQFSSDYCASDDPDEGETGFRNGLFLDSVSDRFGLVSAVMEISIHSLLDGAARSDRHGGRH